MNKLCAAVVNDLGELLPYTCKSTIDAVEESMQEVPGWEKLKDLGSRVVQARLVTEGEHEAKEDAYLGAMALLQEMAVTMMQQEDGKFREPTRPEQQNWARRAQEFLASQSVTQKINAPVAKSRSEAFNPAIQGYAWLEQADEFNGFERRAGISMIKPSPMQGIITELCSVKEAKAFIDSLCQHY